MKLILQVLDWRNARSIWHRPCFSSITGCFFLPFILLAIVIGFIAAFILTTFLGGLLFFVVLRFPFESAVFMGLDDNQNTLLNMSKVGVQITDEIFPTFVINILYVLLIISCMASFIYGSLYRHTYAFIFIYVSLIPFVIPFLLMIIR